MKLEGNEISALMITMSYIRIMTAGNVQMRGLMLSFKVLLKLMVKLKMLLNTG